MGEKKRKGGGGDELQYPRSSYCITAGSLFWIFLGEVEWEQTVTPLLCPAESERAALGRVTRLDFLCCLVRELVKISMYDVATH